MKTKVKIGDEIWVRDTVRSMADSEPSILPENGVWRDSRDVIHANDLPVPYDSPGQCSHTE